MVSTHLKKHARQIGNHFPAPNTRGKNKNICKNHRLDNIIISHSSSMSPDFHSAKRCVLEHDMMAVESGPKTVEGNRDPAGDSKMQLRSFPWKRICHCIHWLPDVNNHKISHSAASIIDVPRSKMWAGVKKDGSGCHDMMGSSDSLLNPNMATRNHDFKKNRQPSSLKTYQDQSTCNF